jgi:hypothetical protein
MPLISEKGTPEYRARPASILRVRGIMLPTGCSHNGMRSIGKLAPVKPNIDMDATLSTMLRSLVNSPKQEIINPNAMAEKEATIKTNINDGHTERGNRNPNRIAPTANPTTTVNKPSMI